MRLSGAEARALLLGRQLLDGAAGLPRGLPGVARAIEHLGYVQLDTIAVVERAHHHTLWTRRADYRPGMLHDLQARDRRIFEYWGHAMCYLPVADYRFSLPRMRAFPRAGTWMAGACATHRRLMGDVLRRVRQEGAVCSSDFAAPPGTKRGTWWDWKPAKMALELLYWRGDLMVAERRNFEKVYDLTERVLPPGTDVTLPDQAECARFVARRALGALGLATEREAADYLHVATRPAVALALRELVAAGEAEPAEVEGLGERFFALREAFSQSSPPRKGRRRLHLLSPFDNLVIHRDRLRRLFGFDYTIECYTPAAKRLYGYFTLPILLGDRLIGRLDPKAERAERRLVVRSVAFEPGFRDFDEALPALAEKLRAFARFNGCDDVSVERTRPAAARGELRRLLR